MNLLIAASLLLLWQAPVQKTVKLEYAPAPIDNPLKGLVPYAGDVRSRFPHSMEFSYLATSDLVVGDGKYDWKALERLLNEVASRGHQAVFRVFLEYPGKKEGIPQYLVEAGLKVHRYQNTNTAPLPPTESLTPDYEDPRLRKMLRDFIAAMGKRYDGDPRIGFITAGLLGTWGEWHTYPKSELFASKSVQIEVMDAYQRAFKVTPILLRYPAGPKHYAHAENISRPMGYHDDSFAWATLDTGKKSDDWFYLASLKAAGGMEKWKRVPIGGEIRPEAWGKVFDPSPGERQIQDFRKCVDQTHVSWLMDSGMFEKKQSMARIQKASEEVRHMGYEFHVKGATARLSDGALEVTFEMENRGVAPFYFDWPLEVAIFRPGGAPGNITRVAGKLTGLLPQSPARSYTARIDMRGEKAESLVVLLRAPNPLKNGRPIGFANKSYGKNVPGWLTLVPSEKAENERGD